MPAAKSSIRPRPDWRSNPDDQQQLREASAGCCAREPSGSVGPVAGAQPLRGPLHGAAFSRAPERSIVRRLTIVPVHKILHVIPSVGPHRGGPSVMMRTLARALSQAGMDVHVATTDDNGADRLNVPLGEPQHEDGATFWYFPRQTNFYTFSWPLTRWLARHVREFDLVHIHALFSYAALPAAVLARWAGVPYIVRPLGTLNRWGIGTGARG